MQETEQRRYDLDWLRVITIFLFFLYGCARFFTSDWWFFKNDPANDTLLRALCRYSDFWQMPMLFLIAGCTAWYSLGIRPWRQFIKERLLRLGVPVVFGTLILVPPIIYLARVMDGSFAGSLFEFYPQFFVGWYSQLVESTGNFSWGSMWLLLYLLVATLVILPLLVYLRGDRGKKAVDALARFTAKPGAILLYALPLSLVLWALIPIFPHDFSLYKDWALFLFYLLFFFYGFLFCTDVRFWQAIDKQKGWMFGLSIALSIWWFVNAILKISGEPYSLTQLALTTLYCLTSLAYVLTLLGYAYKYLQSGSRFLSYSAEAWLPFYVLHLTVIVVLAFIVVQWDMEVWGKFLLLALLSFAVIMLIYEFVIKRVNVIRLLFGMPMKPKKKKSA